MVYIQVLDLYNLFGCVESMCWNPEQFRRRSWHPYRLPKSDNNLGSEWRDDHDYLEYIYIHQGLIVMLLPDRVECALLFCRMSTKPRATCISHRSFWPAADSKASVKPYPTRNEPQTTNAPSNLLIPSIHYDQACKMVCQHKQMEANSERMAQTECKHRRGRSGSSWALCPSR